MLNIEIKNKSYEFNQKKEDNHWLRYIIFS